jgi:hypothetical protein
MAEVGQRVLLPDGQAGMVIGHVRDMVIVSRDIDHETVEIEEGRLRYAASSRAGRIRPTPR